MPSDPPFATSADSPTPMSAATMFFGDGGRKHYSPSGSDTFQFKPGRRKLYPSHSGYEKVGGIKKLTAPVPFCPPRAEQRHLPSASQASAYDVPENSIERQLGVKHIVVRASGEPARNFVSTEITLDVSFGVKKKCTGGIAQQRNGIPVSNPGDKLYAAAEYSPGFFKEFNGGYSRVGGRLGTGGAAHDVPAPGMAAKYAQERDKNILFNPAGMTKTAGRQDTLNFRPRLSYEEKMRIRQTQDAIDDVQELTEGKVCTLNENGASWEDKTGLYVWKGKNVGKKEAA